MTAGEALSNADVATRVATSTWASDSGNITTTQTITMSMSPFLEDGKTYALFAYFRLSSSVAADVAICRLREDSITGTELAQGQFYIPTTSASGFGFMLYGEYTATADGAKTLVFTITRNSGSGNIIQRGAAVAPGRFIADLIVT
jgi:hypothetical protein